MGHIRAPTPISPKRLFTIYTALADIAGLTPAYTQIPTVALVAVILGPSGDKILAVILLFQPSLAGSGAIM